MQEVAERVADPAAQAHRPQTRATQASRFRLLALVAAGWAVLMQIVASASGISIQEDSAVYLGAARNLLAGHGLTVPFGTEQPELLTQYPPFYAVVLAGHRLTGMDIFTFARSVNALFAVVIVVLVIRTSRLITGGSLVVAAMAAVLVVSSTRMIAVNAMVMAEPVMIGLGTLGLYVLVQFLHRGGLGTLLATGGLAGLAALTRYVGVAYGVAGLVLLVAGWRRGRGRRRDVGLYGLMSIGPLAGFIAYSSLATDTPTNRPIGFHPPLASDLRALVDTVGSWVWANESSASTVVGIVVICLTVFAINLLRRPRSKDLDGDVTTMSVLATFAVVYVLVVLAAITFLDASIPGDAPRILLPVLPIVVVLVLAGLREAVRGARLPPIAQTASTLLVLVVVVLPIVTQSIRWTRYARVNGVAVTMKEWSASPLKAELAQASPLHRRIYSNNAAMLYVLTGRHVVDVPADVSVYNRRPRPAFSRELARMEMGLHAGDTALVYFDNGFSPSRRRLEELVDLRPIYRTGAATVFVAAGGPPRDPR